MTLVELSNVLHVPYQTLYAWVRTGLVEARYETPTESKEGARGYRHLAFDLPTAAEVITVERLRRVGVSTKRIRAATVKLREQGIEGWRWLVVCADGEGVLAKDSGALVRVIDDQGLLNVLDLREVRSEARKLLKKAVKMRREGAVWV